MMTKRGMTPFNKYMEGIKITSKRELFGVLKDTQLSMKGWHQAKGNWLSDSIIKI